MSEDNNVLALPLRVIPAHSEPIPAVVAMAERILEAAKSGDLRTLVWVGEIRNPDGAGGEWVRSEWDMPNNDRMVTLGHLTRLIYRINRDIDKDASDGPNPT